MADFKIEFENRFYTTHLESSEETEETIEVKLIMYSTAYNIWKDKKTGTWRNHLSKFELSEGLLKAAGNKVDEVLSNKS